MGSIDFTRASELGVTIAGVVFTHMFLHLVMPFSGWHFVELAFSETFEALALGRRTLWSRSAAFRNRSAWTTSRPPNAHDALPGSVGPLRPRLLAHPARQGAHENGVVEKGHDLLKSALDQAWDGLWISARRSCADAHFAHSLQSGNLGS